MANRRNNNLDNLKDYIIPIIGIFLILFLIYSFFNSVSKKPTEDVENKIGINMEMQIENTVAKIYFSGGNSSDLVDQQLYKGERLAVSEGRVKVEKQGEYSFNVDKIGELEYSEDSKFTITSGKIWLDTEVPLDIVMDFGKIKVSKGSHISFIQNEAISTVYLISGTAEVSNNVGNSVILESKEKIEISRQNAKNEDFNLSSEKKPLNDYFKNTNWFTVNKGESYLVENIEEKDTTQTGSTETENYISNDTLSFGNLQDESHVSGSSIDIYGNYAGNIGKIVVNNTNEATLNPENNTFNFDGVDVSNKVNDLVFKIYDETGELSDKITYTVYYDGGKTSKKTEIKSTKFAADGSNFTFTGPSSEETYTTYDDDVTIQGKVTDSSITRVTVNGYQLTSFNGSTWRYYARKVTQNLEEGTNRYEIKYYNGEKLVYTNYYTIVKKVGTAPSDETIEEKS